MSGCVRYQIPDGRTVAEVIGSLTVDARVGSSQPNYLYYQQAKAQPTGLQYALTKISFAPAHAIAHGTGVRIGIIDSGVDGTHPDLVGLVEKVFNATQSTAVQPSNHGTAIAGIIGANGLIQGVAPKVALLDVNVFEIDSATQNRTATTSNLLRGVDWAVSQRARIINISLAGPRDPLIRDIVVAAHAKGIIMVAAAGNGGPLASPAYPAAYDEVIGVTATDIADQPYRLANSGLYVAVAAPGVDILALALEHGHQIQSGTSLAAAHVSGLLALMLEHSPGVSIDTIVGGLEESATDLGIPGRDNIFGYGRINAYKALVRAGQLAQSKR